MSYSSSFSNSSTRKRAASCESLSAFCRPASSSSVLESLWPASRGRLFSGLSAGLQAKLPPVVAGPQMSRSYSNRKLCDKSLSALINVIVSNTAGSFCLQILPVASLLVHKA